MARHVEGVSRELALRLVREPLSELLEGAHRLREEASGNAVSLCAIVNAKSGLCPEDCRFCAQSARHAASVPAHPMLEPARVVSRAAAAARLGAARFGIVASGRRASPGDIDRACAAVKGIVRRNLISPCASLGELDAPSARRLKQAGLRRYHHNLETSKRFFPSVCTTHWFSDRLRTLTTAKDAGLEVCAGGIFGVGETWEDRVDLALELRTLAVESVPINFLVPVPGTPFGNRAPLEAEEALRVIAIFRYLLPRAELRIAAGRERALGEGQDKMFAAGASALMIGDYLTTMGRAPAEDLGMIARLGLRIEDGIDSHRGHGEHRWMGRRLRRSR